MLVNPENPQQNSLIGEIDPDAWVTMARISGIMDAVAVTQELRIEATISSMRIADETDRRALAANVLGSITAWNKQAYLAASSKSEVGPIFTGTPTAAAELPRRTPRAHLDPPAA